MNKLTIALGDFCHTTKIMANNFTPLNIGYVASYAAKLFGDDVAIRLFKDPKQLLGHLHNEKPKILGLSYYLWNSRLGEYLAEQYRRIMPKGITVFGGPNFPKDRNQMEAFMLKRKRLVDFIIDSEGEEPFAHIIREALSKEPISQVIKSGVPSGCHFIAERGELVFKPDPIIDNLDEIPSPYLSGILDEFLLEKIDGFDVYPIFEGTRGCPFECSFCRNSVEAKKMRAFSSERFIAEIKYVAMLAKEHGRQIPIIMITDQNFGMFERDLPIARKLKEIQDIFGFPQRVIVTTGKGKPELVLKTIDAFPAIGMTMSVQSLDKEVLREIKRINFPIEKFQVYQEKVQSSGGQTGSDIIVGLPKDSKTKHLATIRKLLDSGIDIIIPFSFMMLPGTPVESEESRQEHKIITRYRLIPGAFSEFDGQKVFESEEIAISTSTMSFEDYVSLRRIHLWVMTLFNGNVFPELRRLIKGNGIGFDTFLQEVDSAALSSNTRSSIQILLERFTTMVKSELFDSHENLVNYYSRQYKDLISGQDGVNLLQTFTYLLYREIEGIISLAYASYNNALDVATPSSAERAIFDLMMFRAKCINMLLSGTPPMVDKPIIFNLAHDVPLWIKSRSLDYDALTRLKPISCKVFYSKDAIDKWKYLSKQYGVSVEGMGRVLWRAGLNILSPQICNI